MTRAIDRLIVCGVEGKGGRPEGCWYDLVSQALRMQSCVEPGDDGDGTVWRYRKTELRPDETVTKTPAAETTTETECPPWLHCDAKAEPPAVAPLSPSSAYDETALVRSTTNAGMDRRKALARGELMHRLLQSLPDIAPAARAEAARQHLARSVKDFSGPECEAMIAQVTRVLEDPRFAELFSPGSRAEVPIVGHLAVGGRPIAISGQVDRLAVTADAVLIADYKTNRPAPSRFEEVPPAYVRQLALYRAVLAQLYPGKPVRAALLWTEVPDLMEISATELDAAFAAVTAA